jgi:hypothetical protein
MSVWCGVVSSIFIGHAIILCINIAVEIHCGFGILCVFDTLSPLPLLGRAPRAPQDTLRVDYETGMMDNIVGAVFGYMPAMLITVWALARRHHWLALRLSAVVAATTAALLVSQITVYFVIKDEVDSSTIEMMVESTTPLALVGMAAIWSTAMLFSDRKRWRRDNDRLASSWKVTLAKLLLGVVTAIELAFAITNIFAPFAADGMFHSLTGSSPRHMAALGFSIPRSAATVVIGCAVSHVLAIVPRQTHRQTTLLLAPSALFHVAKSLTLSVTIVNERRSHSTTTDPNRLVSVHSLHVVAGVIIALMVVVVAAWATLACTEAPSGAVSRNAGDDMNEGAIEMNLKDDDSTVSSSSSGLYEPVPSRVRLTDSAVAGERIADSGAVQDPVPARERLLQ